MGLHQLMFIYILLLCRRDRAEDMREPTIYKGVPSAYRNGKAPHKVQLQCLWADQAADALLVVVVGIFIQ
jgi:hypothetical protein